MQIGLLMVTLSRPLFHASKMSMFEEPISLRATICMVLIVIGVLSAFAYLFTFRLRYLAISMVSIWISGTLLHWICAITLWSAPGYLVFHMWKDRRYHRNYPVFASKPVYVRKNVDGEVFHLYLCKFGEHFLIGIDYPLEIDGTINRYQTKWTDRFDDYTSAKKELLSRYETGIR